MIRGPHSVWLKVALYHPRTFACGSTGEREEGRRSASCPLSPVLCLQSATLNIEAHTTHETRETKTLTERQTKAVLQSCCEPGIDPCRRPDLLEWFCCCLPAWCSCRCSCFSLASSLLSLLALPVGASSVLWYGVHVPLQNFDWAFEFLPSFLVSVGSIHSKYRFESQVSPILHPQVRELRSLGCSLAVFLHPSVLWRFSGPD